MSTYNGMPVVFNDEQDSGLLGSLFSEKNNFRSPFSEAERPPNGDSVLTNNGASVFEDDFSYMVDLKLFDSGIKAYESYSSAKLGDREIMFFCEKTSQEHSNLFGTFILVKFGSKARELLNRLNNNAKISINSKLNTKDVNSARGVTTFGDLIKEICENFNRKYGAYTDKEILTAEKIKQLIQLELHSTSSTSIAIKDIYSWYNNGISTVIDTVNKWLEEIKFSKAAYTPNNNHNEFNGIEEILDAGQKVMGALLPGALKSFLENGVDNALSQIKNLVKGTLPEPWVVFLKKIYSTIRTVVELFKNIFENISDFTSEAFFLYNAVLIGFFNGLVSTVQTIISLVGWVLKSNGDKKLTGELYKSIQSKLEFAEDLLDLVCDKIGDFTSGVINLYADFSLEKLKNTLSVFGKKLNGLTRYDYAYFAGSFIFEVVIGVILTFLTMGGSIAAEAANAAEKSYAFLRLIAREVISTATLGIVDILRLFRILIIKFAQACVRGWKGFKQFLENLFRSKADDVAQGEGKMLDELFRLSDEAEIILKKYADNAMAYAKNERPAVVAILERKGKRILAYSNKSGLKSGDLPEGFHPLVKEWLEKTSDIKLRMRPQHGKCAEPAAISKWLWEIDPKGKMKIKQARKEFEGVVSKAMSIKSSSFKAVQHGKPKEACKSCNPLLKHFNIKEIQ
nr:YwqJ-related putative deaminase [uncultured Flavobacterium sp.]